MKTFELKSPKLSKTFIVAMVLGNLSAALIAIISLLSIPKPYDQWFTKLLAIMVPTVLVLTLMTFIIITLKEHSPKRKQEERSTLYQFSSIFTIFFCINYISQSFELKERMLIWAGLIAIIFTGIFILRLLDRLDELWKKVFYQSLSLGSYTTIGTTVMYAIASPNIIDLPRFQPEWCAYFLVFFSITSFFIVSQKYTHEK